MGIEFGFKNFHLVPKRFEHYAVPAGRCVRLFVALLAVAEKCYGQIIAITQRKT